MCTAVRPTSLATSLKVGMGGKPFRLSWRCGELRERNTDAPRLLGWGLADATGLWKARMRNENGKNRERTPRASLEHVLIVSKSLTPKQTVHHWSNLSGKSKDAAKNEASAKPEGLAGPKEQVGASTIRR